MKYVIHRLGWSFDRRFAALALLFLAPVIPACAQVASSSVLGVVSDQSSAPVEQVKVTARHSATGFSRSGMTGAAGQYRIDDLIPGAYTVTAEKPGFRTVTTGAIELEVNQKGRVDLQLEVGSAHDTISVEAAASPVESDDASIGYLLHSATVLSLPLATRNVATLRDARPWRHPTPARRFHQRCSKRLPGQPRTGAIQSCR